MNVRSIFAVLLASVIAIGCAAIETGPTISPITGEEYPEGIPPRDTDATSTATLFIAQAEGAEDDERAREHYQRALEVLDEAADDDPENPQVHYLRGIAQAGVAQPAAAARSFDRAEQLYPAFEIDLEPAREGAWVHAFNLGVDAFNRGDLDEAARLWQGATVLFPQHAPAYQNLAAVHLQEDREAEAIEVYERMLEGIDQPMIRELDEEEIGAREEARAAAMSTLGQLYARAGRFDEAERLFRDYLERHPDDVGARSTFALVLAEMGRDAEALAIFEELLDDPAVTEQDLFTAAIALFQAEEYDRAADTFRRAADRNPYHRDAWFNLVNALYAGERWQDLIEPARHVLEIDPANQNAMLLLAAAHRELGQSDRALEVLEAHEVFPVFLEDLQLAARANQVVLRGLVEGHAASPGSQVRIRVHFHGPDGAHVGTENVTVSAPEPGHTSRFEVVHQTDREVTGYRYEIL